MSKELFREKSLKRVNSPESLNDYVRVSNPGIWLLLIAVIALLIGVFVWGYFGRMESTIEVRAVSVDGEVLCFVRDADVFKLGQDMPVRVETADGTAEGTVAEVVAASRKYSEVAEQYSLLLVGEETEYMVFTIKLDMNLPSGKYTASIVTESIRPLSFLLD